MNSNRRLQNRCGLPRLHWATLVLLALAGAVHAQSTESPRFTIKPIAHDANEGIDLADFDRDGQLDVVAGRNWFAGPDFVPRPIRKIDDWDGYVESNGDFAFDVDRDGWTDVIAGSFLPTKVHWYRNPGREGLHMGHLWKQHLLFETGTSQNEAQLLIDLDGDSQPEWLVNSWARENPLTAWKVNLPQSAESDANGTAANLAKVIIGPQGQAHGMGVGDLDRDGDLDVLIGSGWYENPGQPLAPHWKLHSDWEIQASIPMIVTDLDADGRNDILVGKGHDYGLYWWRQLEPNSEGKLMWEHHLIDDRFSQPHCLHLADLDGDGTDELITGKRWYAHNGGDPGGQEPPCLYYYRFDKSQNRFDRMVIDEGHVGTGLQIRSGDLNGDGKTDLAVAGKNGTFLVLSRTE